MTKPIVPHYVLSESIHIEQSPLAYGVANTYRGVELVRSVKPSDDTSRIAPGHPYRTPQATTVDQEPIPVIVRLLSHFDPPYSAYSQFNFRAVSRSRWQLQYAGAPRILHTLGIDAALVATVEEYLVGTPVRALLHALHLRGEKLPERLALALGSSLLSLWFAAARKTITITADFDDVLLDNHGAVRIRPTYREEESRQEVGAAVLALNQHVATVSPEEVQGQEGDGRSAMFTFGLLLYELLAGAHPFKRQHETLLGTLAAMVQTDAPFLRTKRPDVHPVVAQFVHRCLARDPQQRFSNWNDLDAAYTGMQSVFPPVEIRELAEYIRQMVPEHEGRDLPAVVLPDKRENYRILLQNMTVETDWNTNTAPHRSKFVVVKPIVDREAEYAGRDGRPMLRVSETLLVDARPVTRAEVERYFFATRQQIPALFGVMAANADDACVLITEEIAEAYASWAGKRLPTEAEWDLSVQTLGTERLAVGQIWEWTATEHERGGRVVRGGKWRDQTELPARPDNRSFSTNAARDIGFRCVMAIDETEK